MMGRRTDPDIIRRIRRVMQTDDYQDGHISASDLAARFGLSDRLIRTIDRDMRNSVVHSSVAVSVAVMEDDNED